MTRAANQVVKVGIPGEDRTPSLKVTMSEILATKREFIERNLSFSPEEFAALFDKKVDWALARMRDGSVRVLDEHAKIGKDGTRFSKYARIDAQSVEEYRQSITVQVAS